MPFLNELAARQTDPKKYNSFRRGTPKGFPAGVSVIFGIKKGGGSEIQSIRFKKDKWSVAKAKKWLADHKFKTSIESEGADMQPVNVNQIEKEILAAGKKTHFIRESLCVDLTEAKFDPDGDGSKKVLLTLVKGGWSKNNNFHAIEKIESQLVPLIKNRPKMYLDHLIVPESEVFKKVARSNRDWTATVLTESLKVTDNKLQCEVDFTANPLTCWLYEEARKDPSQVHTSIDVLCEVKENHEAQGRKGDGIENYKFYFSGDFVTYGAAGGMVDSVAENLVALAASDQVALNWAVVGSIGEAIRTLDDIMAKEDKKQKYYDLFWALRSLFWEIANATGETDDTKRTAIDGALTSFVSKIKELDPVALLAKTPSEHTGGEGKEKKAGEVSGVSMEQQKEVKPMLEGTLQEKQDAVLKDEALVSGLRAKFEKDGETSKILGEHAGLTKKVTDLENGISEKDKKISDMEDTVKASQKVLIEAAFTRIVADMKAEKVVTDRLKKQFIEEAKWSDKYEELLKEELTERLAIKGKSEKDDDPTKTKGKIEGFGEIETGASETKPSGSEEKVTSEKAQGILLEEG